MERLIFALAVSALALAALTALLALSARMKKNRVLPRDFDFTRYKRIEQK